MSVGERERKWGETEELQESGTERGREWESRPWKGGEKRTQRGRFGESEPAVPKVFFGVAAQVEVAVIKAKDPEQQQPLRNKTSNRATE